MKSLHKQPSEIQPPYGTDSKLHHSGSRATLLCLECAALRLGDALKCVHTGAREACEELAFRAFAPSLILEIEILVPAINPCVWYLLWLATPGHVDLVDVIIVKVSTSDTIQSSYKVSLLTLHIASVIEGNSPICC